VTLEFTLTHDGNSATDATNITFTDDLNAALNGLASTSGTLTDICGTGSQIMGTISLTFTGGTLAPGASCTFSVTLQVPAMATPGTITNTTSNSMATVSGITATGNAATDVLVVSGLTFSMSFTDDPVIAGDTVTLEFALDNASSALGATDIQFTHNLNSTLSGLAATVLPMNSFCGAGSQITGTTNLTFSGGSLTPGTSCTFSITLQVPVSAADGRLASATSDLSATVNGNNTVTPAATDSLSISSSLLLLS
jgi:hypothetical protein